jgi:APA family basic amino acid/polyamine antiporter
VALTFGEFPAYITAAMLLMEYVLSGAAVARSFTSYLAALCNQSETSFRVHTPDYELDFIAVAMILLLSALLCWGTKESSSFNVAVTAVHIAIMLFIIIAGFTKGDTGNLSPFTPFGGCSMLRRRCVLVVSVAF